MKSLTPSVALAICSLVPSASAAHQPAASVCAGDPLCTETNVFAARITDFRTSTTGRAKVVTASIRFENKLNRTIILGYVGGSGTTTDDQGNRYTIYSADAVRGIGLIASGRVDPKFLLAPGAFGDTRFEMTWGWSGREIFGLTFDMELTVREMAQLPSGQFRLGAEHPLRFRGLANAAASPVSTARPQPSATVASAQPASSSSAPEQVEAPAHVTPRDNCAGIARCFDSGLFASEVLQVSSSFYGNRHHILRFNVRIRNTSNQPLILASTYNSHVVVDNTGGHYAPTAQPVTGMGVVSRGKADPQFVLSPGQSRNVAFEVIRRNTGTTPSGTSFTFDTSIEQLEILPSQQIRSVRQFSLNFPDLTASRMSATAPAANPGEATQRIVDLFRKKKK
ncbi:MAG: hypothetical protein IH602_17025 [Bryobacteraceae bacterium]|nr:hypothetical protein [Bryobacteraceae bacterium]